MKVRPVAFVFTLFILLLVSVTSTSQAAEACTTTSTGFDVSIVTAYYADLEGDGIENDVYVLLQFDIVDVPIYDFVYQIVLELPSGASYVYLVAVRAWVTTVYLNNYFFNHATESGNYTVYVDTLLVAPYNAADSAMMVFDPPGYSEGGDVPPGFTVN